MRTIHLTFHEDAPGSLFQRIQEAAEQASISPASFIKGLLAQELGRPVEPRSVGRPVEGAQVARFKALTKQLQEVYETLRTGIWANQPERFQARFGPQLLELEGLLAEKNLQKLEDFWNKKPWIGV